MTTLTIKTCPLCGSSRIKRLRRTLSRSYRGRNYTVPNVQYFACPDCGERLYDAAAIDKIQAHSPAFARRPAVKKVRKAG